MSTKVETVHAPTVGGSILVAVLFASFVMLTIAGVAVSFVGDRDQGRPGETTLVGRPVVNTPSELSAGSIGGAEQTFAGGTAANTPSELNPVYVRPHRGLSPLKTADSPSPLGNSLGTTTPTELRGGLPAEFYARKR
jgi:hypothetical protein